MVCAQIVSRLGIGIPQMLANLTDKKKKTDHSSLQKVVFMYTYTHGSLLSFSPVYVYVHRCFFPCVLVMLM